MTRISILLLPLSLLAASCGEGGPEDQAAPNGAAAVEANAAKASSPEPLPDIVRVRL